MGLDNLDRVIDIIRRASSHAGAAAELMKGNLLLYDAQFIDPIPLTRMQATCTQDITIKRLF